MLKKQIGKEKLSISGFHILQYLTKRDITVCLSRDSGRNSCSGDGKTNFRGCGEFGTLVNLRRCLS